MYYTTLSGVYILWLCVCLYGEIEVLNDIFVITTCMYTCDYKDTQG